MSLSKVARGRINVAAQTGEPIPPGWAFDADGTPTTDAKAAMAGTMAPIGDAKGAQLALMVEVLSGALSASCFGFESSSYFTSEGPPPRAGQFLLALDPGPFSERRFGARLEDLLAAIEAQPGTLSPGSAGMRCARRPSVTGSRYPGAVRAVGIASRLSSRRPKRWVQRNRTGILARPHLPPIRGCGRGSVANAG